VSGNKFTTPSVSVADTALNGGLNSTSGPLNVDNSESSDLQNIDFSKFGSILQRNGYSQLNTVVPSLSSGTITAFADAGSGEVTVTDGTPVTDGTHGLDTNDVVQITGTTSYNGTFVITKVDNDNFKITTTWVADDATGTWNETANSDGIHWYEYTSSGSTVRKLVQVLGGKLWKMDDLDGTYDDITLAGNMASRVITFSGSGADDMSLSGTFSGNSSDAYVITIDAEGTPDTFTWTVNGGGGATGVAITGSAQLLQEGVSVTFVGTDNHTNTEIQIAGALTQV
jgi:hypothetical protein